MCKCLVGRLFNMSRDVLIVTAFAGFVRSFLMDNIATLQSMGYVVHCAANANHPGADDVVDFLSLSSLVISLVLKSLRKWSAMNNFIAGTLS